MAVFYMHLHVLSRATTKIANGSFSRGTKLPPEDPLTRRVYVLHRQPPVAQNRDLPEIPMLVARENPRGIERLIQRPQVRRQGAQRPRRKFIIVYHSVTIGIVLDDVYDVLVPRQPDDVLDIVRHDKVGDL
jgi:hypothetical protein